MDRHCWENVLPTTNRGLPHFKEDQLLEDEGCVPRHHCDEQTKTQLNSAKRTSMCLQRQRLTRLNVGGDNTSCAMTETCGIVCVRFAEADTTNHSRLIYLNLNGDNYPEIWYLEELGPIIFLR